MADNIIESKQDIPYVNTCYLNGVPYRVDRGVISVRSYREKGFSFRGYRLAIAQGVNATTPLSGVKQTVRPGRVRLTSGIPGGHTYVVDATHSASIPNFAAFPPKVEFDATVNFINSCQDAVQQWSAPTFFGELRETVRMIKHPMQSIVKRSQEYRRKARHYWNKSGKPARQTKEMAGVLSDYYLAWMFGVQPLLGDIRSAAEAFAEIASQNETKVAQGSARDTVVTEVPVTSFAYNGEFLPANAKVKTTITEEYDCRIRGAVILKSDDNSSRPRQFAQRTGGGLDNFIPTLYDLIPFSFVVDYFSNAGDMISAYSAYQQEYAWSCRTTRITQTVRSQVVQEGPAALFPLNNWGNVAGGDFNSTRVMFVRAAGVPPLGFPRFSVKTPNFGQSLNLGALINSLLLCRSVH